MSNLGVAIIKYCFYKKSNWSGIGAEFLKSLKIKGCIHSRIGSSPASSSKTTDFLTKNVKKSVVSFAKNCYSDNNNA
jgi:hypothetical protein